MFPTSTVGRKILMAITGQFMVFYVIAHMIGNSTIYFSNLNAYAAALHALPFLLWIIRLFMFALLCFHIFLGIVFTLENRKAKPQAYAVTNHLSATFSGRNMIWSGAMIGAYLIYHLLHFTFQIIDPATAAIGHPDAFGRPDVFTMVAISFRNLGIVSFYIVGIASLLLHLMHGIQSSFQTWGLNNDRTQPIFTKAGLALAVILFLGYAAIPVSIVMGILK